MLDGGDDAVTSSDGLAIDPGDGNTLEVLGVARLVEDDFAFL